MRSLLLRIEKIVQLPEKRIPSFLYFDIYRQCFAD